MQENFTNSFKQPQVETNFKETNIKIWKVDLVSTYPNLSKEAKLIFTYIDKNGKNKYTAKELKEEIENCLVNMFFKEQ